MSIIVAKCGFNRHTKREVLYGPIELGGANFKLLSVEQGIRQTTYFLRHCWRQDSTVGRLLRCALAWLQMSVGVSYSVLDITRTPLPHMESKWLASLRTFLATIQGSLLLDDPQIPPVQRDGDHHIMDLIINFGSFKPAEIRKLNYCRLYLQAVTISDLTTASSGRTLDSSMLRGDPALQSTTTRWHTIHQERPSDIVWSLWRRANLRWSHPSGILIQPLLGPWLRPIVHDHRRQHFAYIRGDTLYLRQPDGLFQVFHHDRRDQATFHPSHTGVLYHRFSKLPVLSIPVDVVTVLGDTENGWIVQRPLSPIFSVPPAYSSQRQANTFQDYTIKTLKAWEYELLRHTRIIANTDDIVTTALEQGFRVVSDGSVKEAHGNGSFGWVLSSTRGERIISGAGPAKGRALHSYRAEAYGLLSVMRFLIQYREYTRSTSEWPGILATDAQSV